MTGKLEGSTFQFDGPVLALAFSPSKDVLYAGGAFTTVSVNDGNSVTTKTRNGVVAFSTSNFTMQPFDGNISGSVRALATYEDKVFVGGNFTQVAGQACDHMATLEAADGSFLPAFIPSGATYPVNALLVSGTTLYAGRQFDSIGNQARGFVAALSTEDGSIRTGFTPNLDGEVFALALDSGFLYAGGRFTKIDGAVRNGMGAVAADTGRLFSIFAPDSSGGDVYAVAVQNSRIYFGGNFGTVTGQDHQSIVALNADGSPISTFAPAGYSSSVFALLSTPAALYVGTDGTISDESTPAYAAPVDLSVGSGLTNN